MKEINREQEGILHDVKKLGGLLNELAILIEGSATIPDGKRIAKEIQKSADTLGKATEKMYAGWMEDKVNYLKYISVVITIFTLGGGIVFGYGQVTAKTEETIKEVAEVKEKIEKEVDKRESKDERHEADIDELQEFSVRQSMLIERVVDSLDRLDEKIN